MAVVELNYGKITVPFNYDENRFEILDSSTEEASLSDIEINERFDSPIQTSPPEDLIERNDSVLIVVPDATRKTASGQVVNMLVRRLVSNGVSPSRIGIIFATGIHRKVTDEEKKEIVTPFIFQRIKTFDHSAVDLLRLAGFDNGKFADLGYTKDGIKIELNRLLVEFDKVFLVGGVTFHYFAGFTGGRKLICPGLASAHTVLETHKLAFDFDKKSRKEGVGTGLLAGNPVHEAFVEVAEKINPAFSVNTIVNSKGEAANLFCGHWRLAHEQACEFYAAKHTLKITEKRDFVIVSCGGFPLDINMIQAHKALESASYACKDGGTIVLLAECIDGLGRKDFMKWFDVENSEELAERLCSNYEVNGQTAWSLLRKAERFKIKILTELSEEECRKMRMEKVSSLENILPDGAEGYILPSGAKFLVKVKS